MNYEFSEMLDISLLFKVKFLIISSHYLFAEVPKISKVYA